jgi:hypothetical protein
MAGRRKKNKNFVQRGLGEGAALAIGKPADRVALIPTPVAPERSVTAKELAENQFSNGQCALDSAPAFDLPKFQNHPFERFSTASPGRDSFPRRFCPAPVHFFCALRSLAPGIWRGKTSRDELESFFRVTRET